MAAVRFLLHFPRASGGMAGAAVGRALKRVQLGELRWRRKGGGRSVWSEWSERSEVWGCGGDGWRLMGVDRTSGGREWSEWSVGVDSSG